jgi:hypothetical protein
MINIGVELFESANNADARLVSCGKLRTPECSSFSNAILISAIEPPDLELSRIVAMGL